MIVVVYSSRNHMTCFRRSRCLVLLDALLVVGDVGDNGEADWMEARLGLIFERICEPSGAFEMPKTSSQGRVLANQALFAWVCGSNVFLSFGR